MAPNPSPRLVLVLLLALLIASCGPKRIKCGICEPGIECDGDGKHCVAIVNE